MTHVSLFPKITVTKNGETVSLPAIMAGMKAGRWKDPIDKLRLKISQNASKDEVEKLKAKLPYFTASGTFSSRNDKGLIKHSGKIAIDFDKIEEDNRGSVRNILINDKYSEYVFASCSGTGFCVIVNIDSNKHLDSFLFLEDYYKKCYGLEIDKACKDVSRPRYISFDADLFHNPEYYTVSIEPVYTEHPTTTVDSDEEKYDWAKASHDKRFFFVEGQRHHYLVVLAFWLNKCGVSKSYTSGQFGQFVGNGKTPAEITRIVNDCYKNTAQHGTFKINKKIQDLPPEFSDDTKRVFALAHECNNAGRPFTDLDIQSACKHKDNLIHLDESIVRGIFQTVYDKNKDAYGLDDKPDIYKIEFFISKRYDIAKNEVTQRFEYRPKGDNKWQPLNIHNIYRDMQYVNLKFTLEKLRSLLQSDFVPVRNPIKEYFQSLPEYLPDEEPDYITELAAHIITDDQQFWNMQFKKALVRNIACAVDYVENRIIMTLVQPAQEAGKTRFIRFLCPPELNNLYTEMFMDGSKDCDIQLSENFIWNLEELASLDSRDINKLKATFSKSIVKQRHAYGEFAETHPRRVSFWASTNKDQFLTDDQNTRWLCFNVLSVNHDYNNTETMIKKVNIDNVWAQAWHLYKNGFKFQLTSEEKSIRDSANKMYELSSIEKDLILTNFKCVPVDTGEFMTNAELLMELQNMTDNKVKMNTHAISKAMKQLEFISSIRKINGKTVRGFWCGRIGSPLGSQRNIRYDGANHINLDDPLMPAGPGEVVDF